MCNFVPGIIQYLYIANVMEMASFVIYIVLCVLKIRHFFQLVMKRCKQKAKDVLSEDRLLEDKNYLYVLALGIGMRSDLPDGVEDEVEKGVSTTAVQVSKNCLSPQHVPPN